MQPYGVPHMSAIYRAQIAGMVLAPANRRDGSIYLRTNPRQIYLYLLVFFLVLTSPLVYLTMIGPTPLMLAVCFLPAALVLGLVVYSWAKQKVILINENELSYKYTFTRRRTYTFDRIVAMNCLPAGKPRPDGSVPAQNLMVLTFDDKKILKLPILMPGYAELYGIFADRTYFADELEKVAGYYFMLGIDIKNRCTVQQQDIFPGMGGPGAGGAAGGGSSGNSSDPNNPFEGF